MLAGLLAAGRASAQTMNDDGVTLWEADLTTAAGTTVSSSTPGYHNVPGGDEGTLSSRSFTWADNTFNIDFFGIDAESCSDRSDSLSLYTLTSGADWANAADDWVLHVGSHEFRFGDAKTRDNDEATWCGVTAGDLGWTGGDTVTVKIVAPRPRASLVLSPNPISEDSGESTVSATLDRPSSAETTITVSALAVSPATASHFELSSNTTLTIAAGKMDSTGTVTITAANNTTDDDNRRVTVSGTVANTVGVTAPGDATLTIFDDESASTKVTLTVSPKSVQEDATGAARTVTVTAELNRDARVQATDVTVSVAAGTAVEGTDFTAVPEFTFTIAPGATSGTGTFTLAPTNDTLDEPDETVTVTATTVAGLSVLPAAGLTVTIVDDDTPPKVTLVLTPTSIPENLGESVVTATLNRPSTEDVTVTVTAMPVDPATESDFTLSGNPVLTITAGMTTSTGTVTITANDNSDAAEDKKVTVSGMATSAGDVTAPQDVTLTITEDDEASATVTLTVDRATVAEDAAGSDRTVTVTATLDRGAQTENTEVAVSVTGGTATPGTDYTAVNGFTVTIDASETSGTGTFTLAPVDDPVDEPAETVVLTGTTTTGLVVLPAGGVTVTITDNDPSPRVTLELSDHPISEANGMTTVTATLDNPSSAVTTITVRVATLFGSARRDFTLSSNPVLTIAAGGTMSTGTVTITAVDNDVHAPNKVVQVIGRAENSLGVRNPFALILSLIENDVASTKVTLSISPVSVSEGDGASTVTVTATLDDAARPSVTPVTILVSGDSAEAGTDFSVVQDFTLNIGARQTSDSATFTLTPLEDEVDEPAETVTVTGTTSGGLPVEPASGLTLTITDNDPAPQVTLVLDPASIGENGGESTVTATLDRPSTEDTTVTVSAAPGTETTTSDFTLSGTTLTIAAGGQMSTGTVTVTAEDNQVRASAKSVTVSGVAVNTQGVMGPSSRTLTITDDESASTKVTLTVSPASVAENAAPTDRTVTVTAELDGNTRTEDTEVTVTVSDDSAVAGTDYTVVPDFTLTIAGGDTVGTGTFTLAPVDDETDAPDRTVTVRGTTTSSLSVEPASGLTVTIDDDDATPTVTLVLTPASIPENGGESMVTATLDRRSSEATTIMVSALPVAPAVAGDFDLSLAKTLTIAAGSKTSTGTVTITANDNFVDFADKTVTVSGLATNPHNITQPETAMLTIADDDTPSTEVTLTVSPASLSEGATGSEQTVTVTAALDAGARVEDTVVTVSVAAGTAVVGTDFSAVSEVPLTIVAGATSGTATFALEPRDDNIDEPDETVTVRGTTTSGLNVGPASGLTVTITDDDATPKVTLVLTPTSISEAGASSTVTATLDHPSSKATTIMVSASPGTGTAADDFTLSSTTVLTIAAEETASSGTVTLTSNDNATGDGNRPVTVSGNAANDQGVTQPDPQTLTITDDDRMSTTVTLRVSPARVSEGATDDADRTVTVSARLNRAARVEATEVTVSVGAGTAVEGMDFSEVGEFTVTIEANELSGTGTFVLEPVDDNIDEPDETVLVTGAASASGLSVLPAAGRTVTIEDNDDAPAVTLVLTPDSISENGGMSTVTATLDRPSSVNTTITVSATPVSPAVEGDYTLTGTTLTIPAGDTDSTGTVTFTGVDNEAVALAKNVAVSGAARNANSPGVTQPVAQTLRISDDETVSTKVTLTISPDRIPEDATGSAQTVTVTATLDGRSRTADTVVTVSVAAGTAAVGTDFSAVSSFAITIATGETRAAATFDLAPRDNDVDEPDRTVLVSGQTAAEDLTVGPTGGVTLTIGDDEAPPVISLVLTPDSIPEDGGMSTVTAELSHPSSEAVTVGMNVVYGGRHEGVDFDWSDNRILTIPATKKMSTGVVTMTARNNFVDSPNTVLTVKGALSSSELMRGIAFPQARTLTIEDDDEPSTKVTLTVSPASVAENATGSERTVTVTATLDKGARETDIPVTISVAAGTAEAVTDFSPVNDFTLTIAGGARSGTATFDLEPFDDETDEPDETVTVTGAATGEGLSVEPMGGVTVTLADDDEAPQVTLALNPTSISEVAGKSTVTATLDRPSSEDTTITVYASPGSGAQESDFTLSATRTLTIAAGTTASTGTVTITTHDNEVDDGSRSVTVSGTAENANTPGVMQPGAQTLTVTDDDEASTTVTLTVSPARVAENAEGAARTVTVTATLDKAARVADTPVSIMVAGDTAMAGTDYTAVAPFTVTIGARDKTGTGTFELAPIDDRTDEPDETLQVTGTTDDASGLTVVPDGGVTVTLANDDPDPVVSLVLTPPAIAENAGSSTVTATLDRPSAADTTITVVATPVGPATTSDFILSGTTLTIAAGGMSSTGTVTIAGVNNEDMEADKRVTVSGSAENSLGVTPSAAPRLTITDDESLSTTVTLTVSPARVAEDAAGPARTVTVTATLDGSARLTETPIAVTVASGTAEEGTDFTQVAGFTVTIPTGVTSATGTFVLAPVNDEIDELDETVLVKGTTTATISVAPAGGLTVTITDNDPDPVVTLVLTPGSISERGGMSTVTATQDRESSKATTIEVFATPDSPAVGSDFALSATKTLTIAAGDMTSTGTVTITANDNDIDFANKTVSVAGNASNPADIDQPSAATLTITDDELTSTEVRLSVSPANVSEGAGEGARTVTVTARLDAGARVVDTVVTVSVAAGTAAGTDFSAVQPFALTIVAGSASGTATFDLVPLQDTIDEPAETVTVTGTTPVAGLSVKPDGGLTVTITDDDDAPTVTLVLTPDSISENEGTSTVTATLDHASSEATTITVTATASPGTGTAAADLTQSGSVLTIPAFQLDSTGTVTVTAADNNVHAPGKSVTVSGSAGNDQGIEQPSAQTLTITENDTESDTVELTVSPTSLSEGAGESDRTVTVTATLNAAARTTDATVSVTVSGGTATAGDFSAVPDFTVTIGEGETSGSGTFTLAPVDDNRDEPAETVLVRGTTAVLGLTVSPSAGRTVTIEDNEDAPTVTLVLTPASITENEGTSTVTATLSHPSDEVTTVTVSAAPGTDTAAEDFTLSTANTTLTIAAGATESTGTVTVTAVDNAFDDTEEKSVIVSGSAANTLGVQDPSSQTLAITDNESPTSTVNLAVMPGTVSEGATGTVTVTARFDGGPRATDTAVKVTVADGTAEAGTDYTAVPVFTITIVTGDTSATGTFTLAPADDNIDEPNETVVVTGATTVTGLSVAPSDGLTVTIEDNDAPPAVTLVLTPASISENGASSTVTATLDHPSSATTTVTVLVSPVSPAVEGDYMLSGSVLTIDPGDTNSTETVTVTAVENNVHAPDKQVTVSATADNDVGITPPAPAILAITENDLASTMVTLTASPDTVVEGATGTVTVTAALNLAARPADTPVTVSVGDGTAVAGTDYSAVAPFEVTIAAEATSGTGTFALASLTDETDEPDETVLVRGTTTASDLSVAPTGGVPVTIADDDPDPAVTLVLTPASIPEDGGSSTVTATLDRPSSVATTVTVSATPVSPAVEGDYALSANRTLAIAAGAQSSTGTVTIAAEDNDVGAPNRAVTVRGSVVNSLGIVEPSPQTLTISDNEGTSTTVTLTLSPNEVGEGDASQTVTVTATLDAAARPEDAEVSVSVSSDTAASGAVSGTDFSAVSNFTVTIAAGSRSGTGTFELVPIQDPIDEPHETVRVSGTSGTGGLTVVPVGGRTVTITDDDETPTVTLVLTPDSVPEAGGVSTVTAHLDHPSSETTTVTVTAAPVFPAVEGDYSLSGYFLLIGPEETESNTVTITGVDNEAAGPTKQVTVSGAAVNARAVTQPGTVTLKITDDESTSTTVTLTVSPATVAENATGSDRTVTVTATLDGNERLTPTPVAVTVASGTAEEGTDFTQVAGFTVTIATGDTSATGTFTLVPVDDAIDELNETVLVTGTTTTGLSVAPAGGLTVTIADNDADPVVTLVLTPVSISEKDGMSTVTATQDRVSSEATTIAIGATAESPAVANDFALSATKTLTIAAGDMTSTGTVTIAANDNAIDFADKSVSVSGTASNPAGIGQPAAATLTITDDEDESTEVTLTVSPASVSEGATGVARTVTVTAALDAAARAEDTVVTVSVVAGTAVEGTDFSAVSDVALTIVAGATSGHATFDLVPLQDPIDEPDETVTVIGTTTVADLAVKPDGGLTVTIADDDATPTVKLVLTPDSISENEGTSTVTATLDHPSSVETTIMVSAAAGSETAADDFDLSSTTVLTIAAEATTSTGTVTVTTVDNDVHAPGKSVTVSGSARNDRGVIPPTAQTLAITEDDTESDTVELTVSPALLSEGATGSEQTVTVTATLDAAARTADAAVTVTVTGVTATAGTDFSAVAPFTVTIDAGATSGSGTFTLAPTDDAQDEPAETVLVRGTTAVTGLIVSPSAGRTVTIEDNDDAPTVTLVLTPASISENEGKSTVTATLSHPSDEETTVTVSADPGSDTAAEDFTLSTADTLIIAAGATESTGTVTVTAVDNDFDDAQKSVTVSGSAANSLGVQGDPSPQTLAITDDESPTSTVNLTVMPGTVLEGATGTAQTVRVTATFDGGPRATDTEVTVTVADGTALAGTDYTAVPSFTITIATGDTSETGTFTLAPADDNVDEPNETVVVTATTAPGLSVAPSGGLTVTLEDNDATPAVTLVLTPGSISEDGIISSTVTATLDHPSSATTTVTVFASPVSPAVEGDYTLSGSVLTIEAEQTASTGTVTVTAVENNVHAPDKQVTVSATADNDVGITPPAPAILAITENDFASTMVMLTVSPDTVAEGAIRTVTVTAALNRAARPADTPVTVSIGGGTAVAGDDYFTVVPSFTVTIVAGQTEGTGTFALASLPDETDEPDETVLVRGQTTVSSLSVVPSGGVPVTIADDDPDPEVTLVLTPASIPESGGVSTVTATLDRPSSVATTVTVSATPVSPAVEGDYTPSANRTLAIAAGETSSTGTVTIAAEDNDVGAPNREVTVRGSAENTLGIVEPLPQTLTISDNEETSTTVTLTLSRDRVAEGDASQTVTVTATLDAAGRPEDAEVSVSVSSGTADSGTDFSVVSQFTVTIAAGSRSGSGTFDLVPLQDPIDEPDETVRVRGTSGPGGLTVAPADGLTVTITDDDDTPTATLVLTPDSVPEAEGVSTVTARLDHPSSETTTVTVTVTPVSPAVEGDYSLSGSVLTIAAEATASTGTVTITGVDNVLTGPTKEVTVSGEAVNDRAVTQPGTVTLEITDDESLSTRVTLAVSPERVAEEGGPATVTVTATLDGAARLDAAVEIPVTVSAGTAVEGIDFAAVSAITVTIPTGSTSASATFELAPVDNTLDQPDRTVVVRGPATRVSGLDVGPALGRTVTITDDEATPSVTLALSPDLIAESATSTMVAVTLVTATLDVASSEATTVTVTASPVPPAVPGDITLSANRTLTIAAGKTASTGTVTVASVDNVVDAPDKEVRVSGTAVNGHAVTQPDPVTLTITDDEDPSTVVTLTASPDRVAENATGPARRVTVRAAFDEGGRTDDVRVTVSVAGETADEGTDFSTVTDFTITIASGATSGEAGFELIPLDDTVNEADETVVVTGTTASGLTVAPASGVMVFIEDDEEDPVATLVLTPESIGEDGGVSTVSATLDRPTTGATTITVSAAPVDPAVADDYVLSGSVLTIEEGATTSTGTVTITAVQNDVAAPAKRVTVSGTAASDLGVDGPADRTLTIIDDDSPSTAVTLTVSPARVPEDGGTAAVTVTATLDEATRPESTELQIRVTAGTAVEGTDFTAVPDEFTITIDAEARSGEATFDLAPVADRVDEPDETVVVRGPSRVSGLTVGPAAGVAVTIEDDDPTPVVSLVLTPAEVREDGGSSTVTATLDRPSSARTTVTVSATPVSPAVPGDFRQRGTTLTIPAGATESTGSVTFSGVNNDVTNVDRQVTVSGSAANAQGVTEPMPVTLTVEDDDSPSTKVTLTVSPDRVPEGAPRAVTVTATLDGASRTEATEIAMMVSSGTAIAGTDFVEVSDGFTVTIDARAGSGTGSFTLEPVDNDRDEADKTVMVVLSGPATVPAVGAEPAPLTVEPASGLVVTIADDDERGIALHPAALTVAEGASGSYTVTLTSEPTGTGTVTVDVSSQDSDLTVEPEQLSFTASSWNVPQTVTVSVVNDDDVEEDARATVLHEAGGADYASGVAPVSLVVTVPGFEDDVETGTATFLVPDEGGVVTVPDGTSAPAGVELTLPAGLEGGTGTVAVRTVEAAGVEEDSSSSATESPPGFRAGSVMVDIDLGGASLPAGTTATVCLPVDPALDRPRVWRYDESATPPAWVELDEPEGGSPEGKVCGVTEHFSMFAVASSAPGGGALAKSWLARFGRTVAQHVLEGIEERLTAPREAGFEATLAGRRLDTTGGAWQDALALRSRLPGGEDGWHDAWYEPGRNERAVTLRDLVSGSAFRLAAGAGDTGFGAVWGRGAYSLLEGDDAGRRLRGDVTTGTLGADYRRGPWVGGAALSHSEADAEWTSDEGDGRVGMSLTGVYPYAGYAVSERLSVWGAAGYGEGELRLVPDDGERAETGLRLTMGAAGVRGTLPERADGLEAAAKADVLYVRTTSEETEELEASEGSARRIRLGLEGGRRFDLASGGSVTPGLEVGVRHDAGDAETGFGVDAGAGLAWSAPGLRLSGEVNVRGLVVHEDDDFEEWAVSGSLRHEPRETSRRGLSYSLTRSWGDASPESGADALWTRETLSDLGVGGASDSRVRTEAEVGYGFPVLGGRFTGTPHAGLGVSDAGRDYRLGYRLDLVRGKVLRFGLGIEGRVPDGDARTAEPALRLTGALRW